MVYGKLATLLDSFIDDFAEPHLQKERQMAKVIVNNCLQYLNTAVYASTNEDMVAPYACKALPTSPRTRRRKMAV